MTCCSWRMSFRSRCCNHIIEFYTWVSVYTQTVVCYLVSSYTQTKDSYIGKSIAYFNTVLYSVCSFFIWKIQWFQSYLCHYLIGTHYFDLMIKKYIYFYFWNRIPQHQLIPRKHSVLASDFISHNKGKRYAPKYHLVYTTCF